MPFYEELGVAEYEPSITFSSSAKQTRDQSFMVSNCDVPTSKLSEFSAAISTPDYYCALTSWTAHQVGESIKRDVTARSGLGANRVKITAVEAIPFTFWHDREPLSYCLVRVATDADLTGWGEACDSFGCTYAGVIETTVAQAFAPLLIEEELDDPARLIYKLRSWTRRRLGHQWVAMHALSGIELALWDAVGKSRGESIAALLGSDAKPMPIYASSVFLEEGPPNWHIETLAPLIQAGVKAAKLRIGVDWQADLETLAAVREQLDPSVALMIDGNENFTLETALTVADRLSELGIEWFEEPIPQESPEAIAALCAQSPVPIAYGEHMFGVTEFKTASNTYGISVLQPDVATCGGISEAMLIAGLANAAGLRLAPHTASGPIALAANLHFGAAAGASVVEYPFPLAECWAEIAPTCPLTPDAVTDGHLSLPPGPGLGVEIDLDAVRDRPYQPPAPRPGPSTRFMGNV